jgi:hypothetical protein
MFLLESPWPILFTGIAIEAVLAVVLLRTGRGYVLWAMIGTAIIVLVGLVIERLVVTDREAIENGLDAAVAAAEANNIDRLLDCISPTAQETRNDARWMLDRIEVRSCYVRNLTITINDRTNPPTARAHFLAVGQGTDRKGEFPYRSYSRHVTVELRRENGHWLATGYDVEGLNLGNLRAHGLREL